MTSPLPLRRPLQTAVSPRAWRRAPLGPHPGTTPTQDIVNWDMWRPGVTGCHWDSWVLCIGCHGVLWEPREAKSKCFLRMSRGMPPVASSSSIFCHCHLLPLLHWCCQSRVRGSNSLRRAFVTLCVHVLHFCLRVTEKEKKSDKWVWKVKKPVSVSGYTLQLSNMTLTLICVNNHSLWPWESTTVKMCFNLTFRLPHYKHFLTGQCECWVSGS